MIHLNKFSAIILACAVMINGLTDAAHAAGAAPRKVDIAFDKVSVAAQSKISLIYIGAWDCPPCLAWKREVKQSWVSSPEFEQVTYREVEMPSLRDQTYEPSWPSDLRWLVEKQYFFSGVPRFIILVDGKVVGNKSNWPQTFDQIKQLLAKRSH